MYWQLSHVTVLTGYRMLPRKDLVKAKVYFLIDAACAALAFSFHRVGGDGGRSAGRTQLTRSLHSQSMKGSLDIIYSPGDSFLD